MIRAQLFAAIIQLTFVLSSAYHSSWTSRTSNVPAPSSADSKATTDRAASLEGIGFVTDRRTAIFSVGSASLFGSFFLRVPPARAEGKSFAPGGTLVDYEVGVQVGNPLASKSRKADNSNVVFSQDYYYKFGTAAPWIEPGSTEFPKTMPFVLSQQRYEAMKKYRERVQRGVDLVVVLKNSIDNGSFNAIPDGSAPEYSIRPMGLLANNFLASENTGTTNELLLARWYINEISLDIDDIKNSSSKEEALRCYEAALKAVNSYLGLLNRVITPKIGDKWELV